jgi:hypothetical protein
MCKLQVEEFEPRCLLNGSSLFSQPPPEQPFDAGIFAVKMAEGFLTVEYSGRAVYMEWCWPGEDAAEAGMLGNLARSGFDDRGPEPPGSRALERLSPSRAGIGDGGVTLVIDLVLAGTDAARSPETAKTNAVPAVLSVPANNSRGANAAPAEAVLTTTMERPNLPSRLVLENPFGARGPAPEGQRLFAVPSTVWGVPSKGQESGVAGNLGEESKKGSDASGLSATAPAEERSLSMFPKVADVLAVLPSFGLSTLDLNLQPFLKGLESLSPQLPINGDGTRLWPWIVAVTAAATACEIARRELRRPVDVPALEGNGISGR